MIEPWTRWDVTLVRRDFGHAVREAQKHCPVLRQVRVVSSEEVCNASGIAHNRVVFLINPELMAQWQHATSDEDSIQEYGLRQLYAHAVKVLVKANKYIPF